MISSLLHLVGLRPRVYYTLTNFRGGGQGPLGPPPQYANVTHALDSGKVVGGVFIDFKKTYDTVSHNILLRKLEAYGIKNNVIRLIKSYLSDSKQYVQFSDGKSDVKVMAK